VGRSSIRELVRTPALGVHPLKYNYIMATHSQNTDIIDSILTGFFDFVFFVFPTLFVMWIVWGATRYVLKWWGACKISPLHQREARQIQRIFDSIDDDVSTRFDEIFDAGGKLVRRKPRRSNANWWVAYSVMARGKFLDPSKTPSMRRSIHKWIYEHMEADHVTKLDIARVIARAVEWTYHPDLSEVKSVKDRNSEAMVERELEHEAPWWSYWWGVSRRTIGSD